MRTITSRRFPHITVTFEPLKANTAMTRITAYEDGVKEWHVVSRETVDDALKAYTADSPNYEWYEPNARLNVHSCQHVSNHEYVITVGRAQYVLCAKDAIEFKNAYMAMNASYTITDAFTGDTDIYMATNDTEGTE